MKRTVLTIPSSILLSLLFLTLDGVNANFLVILLQGGQVLPSLRELTLLHAFADVPVDECSLGVHQVKFVVETSPSLGDGRGVAEHADGTLDFGQVTAGNSCRWLVVDTDLSTTEGRDVLETIFSRG